MLFGHLVDIVEVMAAGSSQILEPWDFADVYFSWLFTCCPEIEVVDKFLQSLAVLHRRALSLPSLFLKVFSLAQV